MKPIKMIWTGTKFMPIYPTRHGRIINPFNPNEWPTFLPGDKVKDRRDPNKTWRIVSRVAYLDTEQIILRDVSNNTNERLYLASELLPHLEMVAMSK